MQIRVQMKHLPYLRFSGSSVKVQSTFCLIVWGWLKKAIKNKEYFRFSWKKISRLVCRQELNETFCGRQRQLKAKPTWFLSRGLNYSLLIGSFYWKTGFLARWIARASRKWREKNWQHASVSRKVLPCPRKKNEYSLLKIEGILHYQHLFTAIK